MMNYIKQLQGENKEYKAHQVAVRSELKEFSALLHSSKHQGVDMNGNRSDWIATSDVLARLNRIHNALYGFSQ